MAIAGRLLTLPTPISSLLSVPSARGGGAEAARRARGLAAPFRIAVALLIAALAFGAAMAGGVGDNPVFAQTTIDYDDDDDGLIDVRSLAQLDAIRHDLDGNGDAAHADYVAAFPTRDTSAGGRMGCPSGACTGYELRADLDFDTDGDGATYTGTGASASSDSGDDYHNAGNGFEPIGDDSGNRFDAVFKGNGFIISNLFIKRASTGDVGLFGSINGSARIESVGLKNAYVSGGRWTGALVGSNYGTVAASWSSGAVRGEDNVGGLVGTSNKISSGDTGEIIASYSHASAHATVANVGGLAGSILNAYAGGGSLVVASYSTGAVTAGTSNKVAGLTNALSTLTRVTASYWDTTTSGISAGGGGTGQATADLQTVLGYTGIYAGWNVDIDGVAGGDDPWDFGLAGQYPALKYGGMDPAEQREALVDYDVDGDKLIEITALAQLDAIRHDLDGDGTVAAGAPTTAYDAAFPNRSEAIEGNLGCADGTCLGYELAADLDFDTDGDGSTYTGTGASAVGDSGDAAYYNSGNGFEPIGSFAATFKGNGHTISNLFIRRTTAANNLGLFSFITESARVESVGLENAYVYGNGYVGGLVGRNEGVIAASYTSGYVRGGSTGIIGGLTGYTFGAGARLGHVTASYSTADVSADASGQYVGGLIGFAASDSRVAASYSTGTVTSAGSNVGGFLGFIAASGGQPASAAASYWDTTTSSRADDIGTAAPEGVATADLQTVLGYTGIYANWDVDIDGETGGDDPWDFGLAGQYPALKYGGMDPAKQRAELVDFDTDGDRLIEITTLAQLDAVRRDLDGDGTVASGADTTAYNAAFPNRSDAIEGNLGCVGGTCAGYELAADLDFDTDGDGSTYSGTGASADGDDDDTYNNSDAGWNPISTFNTTFKGNGYVISNLFIKRMGATDNNIGLFGVTSGSARIESVGLKDAFVHGRSWTGALVGTNYGTVTTSWSSGAVRGRLSVGGLVGLSDNTAANRTGVIIASYSRASAYANLATGRVGGLVGAINKTAPAAALVTASYSTGAPSAAGAASAVAGLTNVVGSNAQVAASYWDTTSSGRSSGGGGSGQNTAALQSPTGYTGIYANWNVDVDGTEGVDDPWDFGGAGAYPTLKFDGMDPADQRFGDYELDGDGLIEIANLAQLDAVRHDLDGDGDVATGAPTTAYNAAFPERITASGTRMGCPSGTCAGYELLADLDFDTDGDGSTYTGAGASATGDDGDDYYNAGNGFAPIGVDNPSSDRFSATFKGNGHLISNLFIKRTGTSDVGMFGAINGAARVESVGLKDAFVHANDYVGSLVGTNRGTVAASWSSGAVRGRQFIGGLVGYTFASSASEAGTITASYSHASTHASDSANAQVGGLTGVAHSITGFTARIIASYSTGAVAAAVNNNVAGLTNVNGNSSIVNSYWDTTASGISAGGAGAGHSTAALQTPTGYAGIFAAWNVDVDGTTGGDNPWHFDGAGAYPRLKYGGMDPADQTFGDYDLDGDGLIEMTTLAQLDVIRHDLDGDGSVAAGAPLAAYNAAFPERITTPAALMGCPSGTCAGYELLAALDFDTDGDGSTYSGTGASAVSDPGDAYHNGGAGFEPIGTFAAQFRATFKGNGNAISNLFIKRTTTDDVGLFGYIANSARVESVGVENAYVYGRRRVGGLIGESTGVVAASYSTGYVRGGSGGFIGGLVGYVIGSGANVGHVTASYSTAAVSADASGPFIGGLVGSMAAGSRVTASYSTGTVTTGATSGVGGFVGGVFTGNDPATIAASYWDATTSGIADDGDTNTGQGVATADLQTVFDYTGVYENWNVDVDGVPGNDDPWDFGLPGEYPLLKYGGMDPAKQHLTDYDRDGDGLIEITTLAQLDAMRHDLDGNGAVSAGAATFAYNTAFPRRDASSGGRMGCPNGACSGYELIADLDFDTDGDGSTYTGSGNTAAGDSDDAYYDGGLGFTPIGADSGGNRFETTFKGNGHIISNLFIKRASVDDVGMFGALGGGGRVESVGVKDAYVYANEYVGILVGTNRGIVTSSWSSGAVRGKASRIGGLVGYVYSGTIGDQGELIASYSRASAHSESTGNARVGGLAGVVHGSTGSANITAGYSTGPVTAGSGASNVAGLANTDINGTVTASYWDSTTSGVTSGGGGSAQTTTALQAPTGYTTPPANIFANWNVNVDGAAGSDDPWHFGGTTNYPTLKFGGMDPHAQYADGDYDMDDDGLIEIWTLDHLNAVRWDLDGDAVQGSTSDADWKRYSAAFPNAIASLGCPDTDADADSDPGPCEGYELGGDLDFAANPRNAYRNWTPIGSAAADFSAEFEGNNNKIANLKITAPGASASIGLFANSSGTVKRTGLPDARISAIGGDSNTHVGALIGETSGDALGNWSTGTVTQTSGTGGDVGGLIGYSSAGRTGASWSSATVTTDAANAKAGGLGGRVGGKAIAAVYTTGAVKATGPNSYAGGVLGEMEPLADGFKSAYVTGPITKTGTCGGANPLYGLASGLDANAVSGLYWNTETTGYPARPGIQQRGYASTALQTPTDATTIYADWAVDVDGDGAIDTPLWDFGDNMQYPKLTWDGMNADAQTIAPTPRDPYTAPPCAW